MDKIPFIEEGLLDYLQRLYPDTCPEVSQTDREIWMNRGAAGVVRHLQMLHQDQLRKFLGDMPDVL